ncbi:hypothetical protein PYH37_001938 [Sinorhizobium numidicum]|uniref:Uncharacterized protein n=1 Tax=Sinorhizobium numidicum TaxID=680248 RepID=A0ABY8CPB1_9HYPH|nr:hypothetical protein [Sinorhizobium numidicum]WEX74504.1 hypothetical protein PYH37_001938 [Sinorhizobium numidicum]WEX80494.1 hypothetical protein PYH38_001940 [Sinorhizobium numidicum]
MSSGIKRPLTRRNLQMLDDVLRRAGFRKTVMSQHQESLNDAAVFLIGRFTQGISDPDILLAELEDRLG